MAKTVTSTDIYGNTYQITPDVLRWRPAAYGIIVRDSSILLTKQYGMFHLPGGGIELGESPEQAVIREVREETGFIAAKPKLVETQSGYFSYEVSPGNRRHVQSILLYYQCDCTGGEASIDGLDEHEKPIGEMPEWVPLKGLDNIAAGGSMDWRAVVRRAAGL